MRDFNKAPYQRNGFSSSASRQGNRPRFNNRDSDRPSIKYKAVCDQCGKNCEVPFNPTSGKPILCSSCYQNSRSSEPRGFESRGNDTRRFENRTPSSPTYPQYKEQFELLNNKLDKILSMLTPQAPVLPTLEEVITEIKDQEIEEAAPKKEKKPKSPKKKTAKK